jgi:ABC-type antimicrobial peptide transport system permease subunit
MPFSNVRMMAEYASLSLMPRRTAMLLATSFGFISLFLSAVGMYGVLAYLVSQRTREIGIRIALGCTNQGIFRLVLREGLLLVAIGLGIGLGGAIALRRILESQIYGLTAMDPRVIVVVVMVLGAIALAACSLPAQRAMRVNPSSVLNS